MSKTQSTKNNITAHNTFNTTGAGRFFIQIYFWISQHKLEFLLLLGILLIASFLRLYRISEYMTFLGDEGRDAIIVRRFLVNFDPILIGPGTSIGNMYLGPLYYYLMAPALFLSNFSPVGPAVMVAILGILTVFMVWFIAREWFPQPTFKGLAFKGVNIGALVASGLYAISSTVVSFSRSSWNPNIMPFFSLLAIYSIWRVWKHREFKWLYVLGISFAFAMQSHYLGLLLVPVLSLFWFFSLLGVKILKPKVSGNPTLKSFIKSSLIGFSLFLLLMSPLFIFDVRHGWMNFNAMKVFFTERQTTVSARPWTSLPKIPEISNQVVASLMTGSDLKASKVINFGLLFYIVVSLLTLLRKLSKKLDFVYSPNPNLILLAWIFVSLVGMGLYKQHIYDHYFGFFFAAPFLILGLVVQRLFDKSKLFGLLIFVPFTLWIAYININSAWFMGEPGNQYQRSVAVSQKMIEESGGEKFNMATIAERNYEGAYQYFLEKDGANFVMIDPQREKETVANQLFVVCEMPKEKCDPVTNPKAGIANFGWSKVDQEWTVNGVILYKLGHNK